MPRKAAGLTAVDVKSAKPGRHGDGNGLYLLVRRSKSQSTDDQSKALRFWIFRYTPPGKKMREIGLGRAGNGRADVTLADARDRAAELHRKVRGGVDPLAERDANAAATKAAAQDAAARAVTFRTVTERYLAAHEAGWSNPKHRQQWTNTLNTYAFPYLGDLPVSDVATAHILAAIEPIWRTKPETAGRVRGRIEAILDYARAVDLRHGENPARWKGHLSNTLPARGKVAPVEHHAALPWIETSAFMTKLALQSGTGAMALRFAILTAARSGEVLGASWPEFDMTAGIWTVPADRMKAGKEHRVPLSAAALATLRQAAELRDDDSGEYVFPGARRNRPLSNMALAMTLRRMKRGELTAHGFRSTFRDWTAETTAYPREVAEAALAHTLGDKVEAAYRRGDLFEKRRRLMDDWAAFSARPAEGGHVVPMRRAVAQ